MTAPVPPKPRPRKPAAKKAASAPTKRAPAKHAPRSTAPSPSAAPVYKPPVAPDGLGPRGGALWRSVVDVYELRADELSVLEDACREAALIDRLDSALMGAKLVVKGSMGQDVASPLVQEIRQHRMTFASLMARLKLDDADGGEAASPAGRARAVASARWRRTG